MAFTKIPPRGNLAPQVYKQLRKAILRGQLQPGSRLVESRMAEELGVSRTPVREAVSRLVAQGFVKEIEGGVRIVADMEVEIHEVFAIRQLLEGFAARLAAQNASGDELREIERVCQASMRAVESTSVAERAALNNIFHGAIAKASQSDRLIKIISEFYEYAITEEMLPFFATDSSHRHVAQHAEIVDALKARDADLAEAVMRRHLGEIMEAVGKAIRGVRSQATSLEEVESLDEAETDRLIESHS